MRSLIAALKITAFFLVVFVTIPIQALGTLLLGKSPYFFLISKSFYNTVCFIFRIKVQRDGKETKGHVVYVGNHLSYIDIAVVGAHLDATFISKADVKTWPLLGLLATLGKTVFIERSRNAATKCIIDIKKTLASGRSLILFPEGTSTQGTSVLPFKSTLFDLFLNEELKQSLVIQPFTITLKQIEGRQAHTDKDFDTYAWYADMEFMPHLWQLAKSKGAEILITFHSPNKALEYNDRKVFAADCQKKVATGLKNTLPAALDFKPEAP